MSEREGLLRELDEFSAALVRLREKARELPNIGGVCENVFYGDGFAVEIRVEDYPDVATSHNEFMARIAVLKRMITGLQAKADASAASVQDFDKMSNADFGAEDLMPDVKTRAEDASRVAVGGGTLPYFLPDDVNAQEAKKGGAQ